MRSKELPLPLCCRWLTWVAVVPLEEGTEVLRDQAGVSADQGRTGQKVRVPHELLAGGREEVLDKLQGGLRLAGVVQHRRAETDRLTGKGLSRVGGEMDPRVVRRQCRIAQVDLIGEQQVGQTQALYRAQVE